MIRVNEDAFLDSIRMFFKEELNLEPEDLVDLNMDVEQFAQLMNKWMKRKLKEIGV